MLQETILHLLKIIDYINLKSKLLKNKKEN